MPMETQQVVTLVIVVILVLIIACLFIVIVTGFANQRERKYVLEKKTMENNFQKEILTTQLEIQEQTLKTISEEIHDNIGQILSLAKIKLATIPPHEDNAGTTLVSETRELIGKAIQDLRDLSKIISPDYVIEMGLTR
ncbi:MAG: hypothetical protein EOO88_42250, partial [Pedobacter sp.]